MVLDADGAAVVKLPDWFEALNYDFQYQLTCIGQFASVYIAEEISNNQFRIGGGKPEMKISWQVTGIRHDHVAQAHPMVVEEEKSAEERGTYITPEVYGQPEEQGVMWSRLYERRRRLEELEQRQSTIPELPELPAIPTSPIPQQKTGTS